MRVGVLGDIHSNLVALEAVLRSLGPVDQLWCLGDVVGYGPNPNECVARIREVADLCIAGNHDWAALGKIDISDFNPDAAAAARWTAAQLTEESRAFLLARPLMVETSVDGHTVTVTHGSPREPIWEYLLTAAAAAENFEYFSTPLCFVGHTHIASFFSWDEARRRPTAQPARPGLQLQLVPGVRLIANPGSVGQPRDRDPRAAYLVYETNGHTLTWHRVAYDIAETQARMREAGLPPRLAERLNYGL